MIEQRTTTFGWASTPNASVSRKKVNAEVVGTNWVQNPTALGGTSSFTGAVPSDYTGGSRARAYKGTATSVNASTFGLTTAEQPAAAPGDVWWAHALVQADSTVYGARKVTLTCRFRDGVGGAILGSATTSQDIIPTGVFHRWTGTVNESASEEYSGTVKRTNDVLNPSFAVTRATWDGDQDRQVFAWVNQSMRAIISLVDTIPGPLIWTSNMPVTPGTVKSGMLDAMSTNTSVQYYAMIRFYDSSGNAIAGSDKQGTPTTIGTRTTLSVNGAVAPAGAATYRLMFGSVTAISPQATHYIYRGFAETAATVGAFFDGSSANTGTGNVPDVFELAVEGTAPAGTKAVEVAITRNSSYAPASGDIIWFTDVALIEPNAQTPKAYFDGDFPQSVDFVNVERPGEITTDEWVEIDGVPLNTYAYNIMTWGGSRLSPPAIRGSNITVPGRPGTVFQERELDSAEYGINMWVQGTNEDGSIPTDRSLAMVFDRNWRKLRRLMFQIKREITITKRWYDYDTEAVRSASAKATYNGGLEPTMTGRARALFAPTFLLSSPFFYENSPVVLPVSSTQQKTWQVDVEGDWTTTAIEATIRGPRLNPKIAISHEDGTQVWLQYQGSLASGDVLVIDVDTFEATLTTSNGTVRRVSGNVDHGGAKAWLSLDQGDNTIVLTSDSGAGPVSLSYVPVWF